MWLNKDNHTLLNEGNEFKSFRKAFDKESDFKLIRWLTGISIALFLFLLLPWTQNIQALGLITTRSPEERPQELNSVISGKIEKWYAKEGDLVQKGDTILKISEVEETYLDPELLQRTNEQIKAKEGAIDFYQNKVSAIENQIDATFKMRSLKSQQLEKKIRQVGLLVVSDSMALKAAETDVKIARDQFKRQEELYKQGLKSLTELEQRKQQLQNAEAKLTIAENKLANTRNDLLIAEIELNQVYNEYSEKLAKSEGDKYSSLSEITNAEGEVAKLKNKFSNIAIRNGFYYILAPQNGQVTKTISSGIGEVIKSGQMVAKVVPQDFEYAVEMYIKPIDLPLVAIGQKVRLQFDGWPAIVFSGWPGSSFGTYGGKVAAIDNSISDNGKFRILVVEDPNDEKWPKALKVGGGAKGMALLKDVSIIYELWRNINGFPPDFYEKVSDNTTKNEK